MLSLLHSITGVLLLLLVQIQPASREEVEWEGDVR